MSDSTEPGRPDDGFDDPTAAPWDGPQPAPPTQPLPTEPPVTPPSPYPTPDAGAPDSWTTPPAAPAPYPYPQAPSPQDTNPYAPPGSPPTPYGPPGSATNPAGGGLSPHDQPAWVQQPYGSTAYGQTPYALPPAPWGAPPPSNTALPLTIISAFATLLCCLFCLPSLIIGIVALSKQSTDPYGAAKLTRWGWIILGIMAVLAVVGVVAFFAIGAASGMFDGGSSGYEGT